MLHHLFGPAVSPPQLRWTRRPSSCPSPSAQKVICWAADWNHTAAGSFAWRAGRGACRCCCQGWPTLRLCTVFKKQTLSRVRGGAMTALLHGGCRCSNLGGGRSAGLQHSEQRRRERSSRPRGAAAPARGGVVGAGARE